MNSQRLFAVLISLAGLALGFRLNAASSAPDEQAFNAATLSFSKEDYRRADADLGSFVEKFPTSGRRAEAVLYRAQARFKLANFAGALDLLTNSLPDAGAWTGDYLVWLGEAQLGLGNPSEAAKTFARVSQATSAPDLLRLACIGEAKARFKEDDFERVVRLLGAKESPLQTGLDAKPDAEPMVQGQLLLAEALLRLRRFRELDRALERFSSVTLPPELDWHRLWLRASGQREEADLTNALATASNLVEVARIAGRRSLVAESVSFLGGVHRQLGHDSDAIAVFRQNLTTNALEGARQQALVNVISLQLDRNRFADATNEIQGYTAQFPLESNVWSLVLGDMQLREYARMLAGTNAQSAQLKLLTEAHATLAKALSGLTNNDLEGHAQLLLGWCFWEERNFAESAKAFQIAATKLPPSADQLLARFKLADIQLRRDDATNAAAAYAQLVKEVARQPDARRFVEPMLYQWLRASIKIGDSQGASRAMQRLLDDFPLSQCTENGLMMLVQWQVHSDPAGARALCLEFSSVFTNSTLLPEVGLMVASTYELERNWEGALNQYDEWLARFGGNTNRPFAEYSRALCAWQAGDATTALHSLTNFVEHYPTNSLTPRAQQRIAEEFLLRRQFVDAERTYANIFLSTNWSDTEVTLAAGLGAARAAFLGQGYTRAREYLTNVVSQLIADSNAPPELTAKAYLMLGDTLIEQYLEPNGAETFWNNAIVAYGNVAAFGTNQLWAQALGRKGAAYFQHRNRDTNDFANATNAWQQVIDLEVDKRKIADVETRNKAEVAIGMALESLASQRQGKEREALLGEAEQRYKNVIYPGNRSEYEPPNPRWYKEAALRAAGLAQERGDPRLALNLYGELLRQFPFLQAEIAQLIERAKGRAAAKDN